MALATRRAWGVGRLALRRSSIESNGTRTGWVAPRATTRTDVRAKRSDFSCRGSADNIIARRGRAIICAGGERDRLGSRAHLQEIERSGAHDGRGGARRAGLKLGGGWGWLSICEAASNATNTTAPPMRHAPANQGPPARALTVRPVVWRSVVPLKEVEPIAAAISFCRRKRPGERRGKVCHWPVCGGRRNSGPRARHSAGGGRGGARVDARPRLCTTRSGPGGRGKENRRNRAPPIRV